MSPDVRVKPDLVGNATIWNDDEQLQLKNVHNKALCFHRGSCTIHFPTDHHMRDWYLLWRDDRGIFERICEHGVGHPDPDQFSYWKQTHQESQAVHGCDGCCSPPK